MTEPLDRPRCEATITTTGEVEVSVGGIESRHETLDAALSHLGETAAGLRRPIKLTARDADAPDDPQYLIVDEQGHASADPKPPRKPKRGRRTGSTSVPATEDETNEGTLASDLLGPTEPQQAPESDPSDSDPEVEDAPASDMDTEPSPDQDVSTPEPSPALDEDAPEPQAQPIPEPESVPEHTPEPETVTQAPVPESAAPDPRPAEAARGDQAGSPQFVNPGNAARQAPAVEGWQGWLNRVFGAHLAPSPREQHHRQTLAAIQQQWIGPRTVAVLNSKGGANKTPTTVRLASEVARAGGGGVLAWDNNESLGTLGWRVEKEQHGSTVVDFIHAAPSFLSADAHRADLARYVHHQGQDKFDALVSDDDPAHHHLISGEEVDLLHEVAARNWRLIVMDSGNATRGDHFERMIHHADQIVLATTQITDTCQGAVDSWRALVSRGGHAADLARNAVVIVSQTNVAGVPAHMVHSIEEIREKFGPYVRAVHVVPFDPALVQGVMRAQDLRPATVQAWQAATAAVIEQF